MATVRFLFTKPDADGVSVPVEGTLRFSPTKRLVLSGAPGVTVMPIPFVVSLDEEGAANVDLEPTGTGWAWRVEVSVKGATPFSRYVSVPSVPTVNFTDLTVVDKTTLTAKVEPTAAWYAYVDDLKLSVNTSLAAVTTSRDAAVAAQDAAIESQDSAATSASLANASADSAGTSAFNAGQSAAIALGHRNDTEDFATSASSSAAAAALSATAADSHADAAQLSATASASARDAAQAAKTASETLLADAEFVATGFSIGEVTTGDPGEDASATITGEAPNRLLNLDLPRGFTGPANTLTILDTVTGPETPGATGPQGVKGDKGDPGGWAASTILSAGTNLNDIVTSGLYLNPQSNAANGPSNSTNGGHLEVIASANWVYQRYTPISEQRETYVRHRTSSSVWSAWSVLNSTRVDQTAGRAIYQWDDLNNREQLIYGDTGWRDISASLINGWTGTWCRIRRFGSEVTLTFLAMNSSVATADSFFTAPAGFKANTGGYHQGFWFTDTTVATGFLRLTGGGSLELTRRPATAYSASLQAVVKWTTDDAWPTTLPGTAVGTIPNL